MIREPSVIPGGKLFWGGIRCAGRTSVVVAWMQRNDASRYSFFAAEKRVTRQRGETRNKTYGFLPKTSRNDEQCAMLRSMHSHGRPWERDHKYIKQCAMLKRMHSHGRPWERDQKQDPSWRQDDRQAKSRTVQ